MTRLGAFLRAHKVRQTELARKAGVSRGYITTLVAGSSDPTRGMMVRIAAALSWLIQTPVPVIDVFDLTYVAPRAEVLQGLKTVAHQAERTLQAIDRARGTIADEKRKEAQRGVIELREAAQALHQRIERTWER